MANGVISIDIIANDYATAIFNNVASAVKSLPSRLGKGLNDVNSVLNRYNNTMRGFNTTVTRVLTTAGRAVVNFTSDSIKQYAELEKQHAKTMGAMSVDYDFNWSGKNTPQQIENMHRFYEDAEKLKRQAYELGSVGPTGNGSLFGPNEISAAQTALRRAGVTAEQMLNSDIVDSIVKFAGGNDIDIEDAVSFGVQLGAQFDKKPEEWGEMFDQVTYAANSAPIDVSDVMQSLKYVGNMASAYDVPLSDILSAIAIMGNAGLRGSQAGSGVNAIFSRGMNPTGLGATSNPPTEHVEQVYKDFVSKVIDENGSFIGLEGFTGELQDTMEGLTDQELAWFNKKMFGMYQQKAALALGRSDGDADKIFGDLSEAIENRSEGINDTIYELMLSSTGGMIEAIGHSFDTVKMEFGDALSPLTKEVSKQLIKGLNTKNFSIDIDSLQAALDEAVQRVNDEFGEQIAGYVEKIGNLGIDALQIGEAELPLIENHIDAFVKLFSGDFPGAVESWKKGFEETGSAISGLPEELQGAATAVKNFAGAFEIIFAMDIAANVGEVVTSLLILGGAIGGVVSYIKGMFGKNVIGGNGKASLNTNVTSQNVTVNTSNTVINSGQVSSASFGQVGSANIAGINSFMANTSTMTVTAGTVIVNGATGTGTNPLGGNGPVNSFVNGMAQGAGIAAGGGATVLGGGAILGGVLLGGGGAGAANMLLGGGQQVIPMLNAGAAGATGAGAAGAGTVASSVGLGIGAKLLTGAGALAITLPLMISDAGIEGNISEFTKSYSEAISKGIYNTDEIMAYCGYMSDNMYDAMKDAWSRYTGDMSMVDFSKYWMETTYPGIYNQYNGGNQPVEFVEGAKLGNKFVQFDEWLDSYRKSLAFANSAEGMQKFYDASLAQIKGKDNDYSGKLDEKFLKKFFNENGLEISGGYGQQLVEMMFANMFGNDKYNRPDMYAGDFADSSITTFFMKNMWNKSDWTNNGTIAQVMSALNGVLDGLDLVSGDIYKDQNGNKFKLDDDGKLSPIAYSVSGMESGIGQMNGNISGVEGATKANGAAISSIVSGVASLGGVLGDFVTSQKDKGVDDAVLMEVVKATLDNYQISPKDVAEQLVGNIDILSLGQGPLSTKGAIDYIAKQLSPYGNGANRYPQSDVSDFLNTSLFDRINNAGGNMADMMSMFNALNGNIAAMNDNLSSRDAGNTVETLSNVISSGFANIGALMQSNFGADNNEALISAFNSGFASYSAAVESAISSMDSKVLSVSEAVATLINNNKFDILGLKQGPLSNEGAYNYVMNQIVSGNSINQGLLQSISSGISQLDPSLTVDITTQAPVVNTNVDVKVNVDKSGNTTTSKNVITNNSPTLKDIFKSTQRYGTTWKGKGR